MQIRMKLESKVLQGKISRVLHRQIEARSGNDFCRGKTISGTYTDCVFVALGIRHAKRMCRNIVSSMACSALHYFSTLSHQRHSFREKLFNTRCVF